MAGCESSALERMQWWAGCNDWLGRSCFMSLGITFGCCCVPMELTVLCAIVCRVGDCDARIREIRLYK